MLHHCIGLARYLHDGQVDKGGKPYFDHVERVAHRLHDLFPGCSKYAIMAAYLHDAIEDCGVTMRDLIDDGVPSTTAYYVDWLSRVSSLTYQEWINDLCEEAPAEVLMIKLADNLDNQDPSHPAQGNMVEKRYKPAEAKLRRALRVRGYNC